MWGLGIRRLLDGHPGSFIMHDDVIAAKGSVRTLTAAELPLLREHLLRLDPESRRDRFNGYADDGFIARYAAKCQSDGTIVVAYIEDGAVRGAAELHQPGLSDPMSEIAFSVEAGLRRQGVGSILFTRLIAKARSLGYDSLQITTGSQNGAMRALAHKFGAHLSFRRGESSGSINLAAGRAVGAATPLEAARAMMNFNRACWVILFRFYGFGRTV
jgi:GNAT superfamily N-acetyltransferase